MQPPLSAYAHRRKVSFFLRYCSAGDRMLEVGSGSGMATRFFRKHGMECVSLDIRPPADIVGDIREWKKLGLKPGSFDVVAAFEVLEHVDFLKAARQLLKPGGLLFLTTPVPTHDGILRFLEAIRLSQRRTSAHSNLVDVRTLPGFETVIYKRIMGLSQWAVLRVCKEK